VGKRRRLGEDLRWSCRETDEVSSTSLRLESSPVFDLPKGKLTVARGKFSLFRLQTPLIHSNRGSKSSSLTTFPFLFTSLTFQDDENEEETAEVPSSDTLPTADEENESALLLKQRPHSHGETLFSIAFSFSCFFRVLFECFLLELTEKFGGLRRILTVFLCSQ
jgi:hypothetical protein